LPRFARLSASAARLPTLYVDTQALLTSPSGYRGSRADLEAAQS